MTENLQTIKIALNLAVSTIATEHFFTTFLSSPKASERFFTHEEVQEMFKLAMIVSLGFATIMSLLLRNVWGIVSAVVLILIFAYAYRKSLGLR